MNPKPRRTSKIAGHRKALKKLLVEVRKRPNEFLPERSVGALNQFFAGYQVFGSPVWRDLNSFERWLPQRLFYPPDAGARWWRFIQLNSTDNFHGYQLFLELYSEYLNEEPTDIQPTAADFRPDPATFDFHMLLFNLGRKPGMYLGAGDSVYLIAAFLAGYFKGRRDAGLKLTRDEKIFLRFEAWIQKHHKFTHQYPWYRLVEMWPYAALNSFDCFFADYDAYLTNYGKNPRGLDDLFLVETTEKETVTRRRRKTEMPSQVIRILESKRWWRQ